MKTLSRPMQRNSRGYALIIILLSLAIMLILFASMMYWISSNSTVTSRNNQFNMSEAAAEAATEEVLSQMTYDYINQSLSNSATYYGTQFIPSPTNEQADWPIKYAYSDTNGVSNQISVYLGPWSTNTVPLGSQYTNLYGLKQDCIITATATPIGQQFNVPATVCESIQFAAIPVFQFAIFYNMDLEIDPGQTMAIKGSVWSNGGIWSGSANVWYSNTVAAVGTVTYAPSTNDPWCNGKNDGGTPLANFAIHPTSGNDRITMPIGTNNDPATVAALIDLAPAPYTLNTALAYTTNGLVYFANGADLYLTNWGINTRSAPTGTNMILYYQDVANVSKGPLYQYMIPLPYDYYYVNNLTNHIPFSTNNISPSTSTNVYAFCNNIKYAGYSFLTNVVFYDWREGWNSGVPKAVQAVQIDIGKYNTWLTNVAANNGGSTYNTQCLDPSDKSHPIDSIYIYNGVPLTGTTLPAVRVYNGGMLPTQTAPKGFTVATKMPLYVYGNYNVSNTTCSVLGKNSTGSCTWPSALIADAITILSVNWNDNVSNTLPTPLTTTVNAAMLEGIVRSTNISNPGIYSGGVENFLRLLENWSQSIPLWYNGSIVVMFPSQMATNYQVAPSSSGYYNAPARNWAFDTNFTLQIGLPPLTPQNKGVIRASWNAY